MSPAIHTRFRGLAIACLLACGILLTLSSAAGASQGVVSGSFTVTPSTQQAGGHPDIEVSFALESPGDPESAREVSIETPEGVFGNPNAIDRCIAEDFALSQCPPSAQAGLVTIWASQGGNPETLLGTAPVYDLEPGADQTGLFGFNVPTLDIPIQVPIAIRTGTDYGLRFTVAGLTQLAPLQGADLTLWGFPADAVHDGQRFAKGSLEKPAGCPGVEAAAVAGASCLKGAKVIAGIAVNPLINGPSVCAGPLSATIEVTTYQDPADPTTESAEYPESLDCYAMTFKPNLLGTPTTKEADSAAGLDLEMSVFQPLGKTATPSPIRKAVLTLPSGLTINPDAADGQSACPDADAEFGTEARAHCPDNAKIGTFSVGSPALDGRLNGSLYIGEPRPGDQYRLFMIADGFGIHAKFLGSFHPDPQTGQVTAVFDGLPQVPFDNFQLHLFSSDRGLMATPAQCRIYEIEGHFFPWNDLLADVSTAQHFSIDSGPGGQPCPGQVRRFQPRLVSGTSNPTAGAFSDFRLRLERDDGDQYLGDVNFTLPPGFTGDLRGIAYCPEASIQAAAQNAGTAERATPTCPASSFVGTSNVAAGPGTHPFHATGRMYLAGPFRGAPLSVVAVTPALAGPYDYGVVVVRVALHVDPLTAQVRALSDTIPAIVGGIPLRIRSIQVNIDRADFTINPTNCSSFSVDSQGIGDQGTVVDFSSYFHVVNCRSLPFKPKMTVRQVGKRRDTRRARNPELQFDLRTRPGDANIKSLTVTLPNAFNIDQRHLGDICSEKELVEKQCAGRTAIGTATTTTPLLDQPLAGPAYAVSGGGGLPRLAFLLDGQVSLVPRAETVTDRKGRLQTTVPVVPDAPIGHFRLNVFGGKRGYLVNTRSLCAGPAVVRVRYLGQNGRTRNQAVKVRAACGKNKARSKRHSRHSG